jgi:hypothetical protein
LIIVSKAGKKSAIKTPYQNTDAPDHEPNKKGRCNECDGPVSHGTTGVVVLVVVVVLVLVTTVGTDVLSVIPPPARRPLLPEFDPLFAPIE